MNAVGLLLAEVDDRPPPAAAEVFLRSADGHGVELIPRSRAEVLLEQATASPLFDVTGDLIRGFAWPVHGARPRRSYAVIPLATPVWPNTARPTAVTVELWWSADSHGRRHIRSFVVWADDPYDAYLLACCLWSSKATGAGAVAAFLYGPDRRIAYRINAAAWTCAHVSAETVARVVVTSTDCVSAEPLPDTPRTCAMHEQRVDGVLTYTGTSEEISVCLREHADGREASMDAPAAYAMREAAGEIERGARTEFRGMAHYRVDEPAGSAKAGEGR
ncbi:hypothetical protein [Catenulispora rubra]|uniref:hypothetical protein n=1 Tax=Catenulispora rubra TaxID=280293 RepID=UPI0018924EC2|nr:hypothetical protein [Catenulispora rubra]